MTLEATYTAIVVEDEPKARENLLLLLESFCPRVTVAGAAASLEEAERLFSVTKPAIAFLDVQLGSRNIFELLGRITNIPRAIIFVTAYEQYALKAFEVMAVDYLLKPLEIPSLIKAVGRAIDNVDARSLSGRYQQLLLNMATGKPEQHKVAFSTASGYQLVVVGDILYCRAEGSYTHVHFTDGGKLLVSKNLKHYERLLADYHFLRSHLSYLVNTAHINRVDRTDGGAIVLEGRVRLPINPDTRKALEARIKKTRRLI